MPTVWFLRGLPASGKTMFSKNLLEEHLDTIRVNKDDIREMLDECCPEYPFALPLIKKMLFLGVKNNIDNKFAINVRQTLIDYFKKDEEISNKLNQAMKSSWSKSKEEIIRLIQKIIMEKAVEFDKNIISDNTNYNHEHYMETFDIAPNYIVEIIDMHKTFSVTLEECLIRNKNRLNKVPDIAIITMANNYNVFEK